MVLKSKKEDIRIIKTKQSLKKSLVSLLVNKKIEDITITELTALSGVNRKTFYLHYKDVESVLKDIEDNLTNKLISLLKDFELSEATFHEFIYLSLNAIVEDEYALCVFLNTANSKDIIKIIDKIYLDFLYSHLKEKYPLVNKEKLAYIVEYHVYGTIKTFYLWIKTEKSTMDLKAFSVFLASVINDGINRFTVNASCDN